MAPTRCGAIPAAELIKYCMKADDLKEVKNVCMKTGGFVSHLGTSDAREVNAMADSGNAYAKLIWDAMRYQIVKYIGAMAGVLHGQVDGILLGGGMVHNKDLVKAIEDGCGWIAPVSAYPGEFELEAMAAGAIRVLSGEEQAKTYTGKPRWSPSEIED